MEDKSDKNELFKSADPTKHEFPDIKCHSSTVYKDNLYLFGGNKDAEMDC